MERRGSPAAAPVGQGPAGALPTGPAPRPSHPHQFHNPSPIPSLASPLSLDPLPLPRLPPALPHASSTRRAPAPPDPWPSSLCYPDPASAPPSSCLPHHCWIAPPLHLAATSEQPRRSHPYLTGQPLHGLPPSPSCCTGSMRRPRPHHVT